MEHVLLVIHVIIATALIGAVLIQRSDSDGFGLGSGSGANFMTGRATANLLTRTTAILAALFIVNSLALSMLAAHGGDGSIVDTINEQEAADPAIPLHIDEDSDAVETGLNRDAVMDTDRAAKKAAAEKSEAPAAAEETQAPAVPTAE